MRTPTPAASTAAGDTTIASGAATTCTTRPNQVEDVRGQALQPDEGGKREQQGERGEQRGFEPVPYLGVVESEDRHRPVELDDPEGGNEGADAEHLVQQRAGKAGPMLHQCLLSSASEGPGCWQRHGGGEGAGEADLGALQGLGPAELPLTLTGGNPAATFGTVVCVFETTVLGRVVSGQFTITAHGLTSNAIGFTLPAERVKARR